MKTMESERSAERNTNEAPRNERKGLQMNEKASKRMANRSSQRNERNRSPAGEIEVRRMTDQTRFLANFKPEVQTRFYSLNLLT